jgi:hypothetical protein
VSRATSAAAFQIEVAELLGVRPCDLTWKQVIAGARKLRLGMSPAVEVEARRIEWDQRHRRITAKIDACFPPELRWSPHEARCLLRAYAYRIETDDRASAPPLPIVAPGFEAAALAAIRSALRLTRASPDPLESREAFERFCAVELKTTPAFLRTLCPI